MADLLDVIHAAVSATCATVYPRDTLGETGVMAVVGAVRPANESVSMKAARLAARVLYEAGQQDVGLRIGKSELAKALENPGEATVAEFASSLEEEHMG